ncbi:Aspartate/methionine/tyrosine aminotransferase [Brevibacterium aurantiacum]|uniref:Aminotransferase n=3 Tax=Brevibacterium TaxID=1696 RepID=A0A2H1IMJ0_BREAU|nr:aminotransferase class I/II-fold pyridoxal phosphate-dependent enzyme [Brevibacterium aurantiacum]SMX76192.1 Aspartate/methionine/tyrosine aminotransferase [Brevibacterium aurantiacum]
MMTARTPAEAAPTTPAPAASVPAASARSGLVRPFAAMGIVATVGQMQRAGRDTIAMCLGEPTQGAPSPVLARAAEVARDGTGLGYSPIFGIPELREAIAGHYRDWYGLDIAPERIAVTTGSSGAFQTTFLTCFDVGDRVALARPGYGAYKNILTALGCEVVELDCGADEGFQPSVELLAAAHAEAPLKGLMLASPANPTGTMIGAEALGKLMDWCREHGVQVISDEIYHGITYIGTRGETALAHDDNAIVISSFSKYWGMTGWRLGWAILPEALISPAQNVTGNLSLCAPVPAQYAAVAGFTEESYAECEAAVASFAGAREHVLSARSDLGFGEMAPPDGAFYMYARIDEILDRAGLDTAGQWCGQVLEATGVALAPGDDFDTVNGPRSVRLSLAVGAERTAEAIDRILDFMG